MCILSLSFVAQASLKSEMIKMENATNALLATENAQDFLFVAEQVIQSIEEATVHLPPKIFQDDERAIDDYQRAMQALIDLINEATVLAEEGKLNEAKAKAWKLFQLKSRYHMEYK